jgi:hypothetical protein
MRQVAQLQPSFHRAVVPCGAFAVQHPGDAVLVKRFVDEPPLAPALRLFVDDAELLPGARPLEGLGH